MLARTETSGDKVGGLLRAYDGVTGAVLRLHCSEEGVSDETTMRQSPADAPCVASRPDDSPAAGWRACPRSTELGPDPDYLRLSVHLQPVGFARRNCGG